MQAFTSFILKFLILNQAFDPSKNFLLLCHSDNFDKLTTYYPINQLSLQTFFLFSSACFIKIKSIESQQIIEKQRFKINI